MNNSIQIGIVGTGRIGRALGRLLHSSGFPLVGMAGRSVESSREAAAFVGSGVTGDSVQGLSERATHLLLAVTDRALPEVVQKLAQQPTCAQVVLHTCGGRGPEILSPLGERGAATGVLHPLQTVPTPEAGIAQLPGSYFAVAGNEEAWKLSQSIVEALGGKILRIHADRWPHYHAAAVMASNYQTTLLDCALELMDLAGVESDMALPALYPIVQASTQNIFRLGPERALTGAIQRNDGETIRSHLAALRDAAPETSRLYAAAGLRTLPMARRRGLPASETTEIKAALEAALPGDVK